MTLLIIPLLPLVAVLVSLVPSGQMLPRLATLLAAAAVLVLALTDAWHVATTGPIVAFAGWVALDSFSAIILLLNAFVALTAALFSWGYLTAHGYDARRTGSYCVHFNLFVFSLTLVSILDQPALVWIAIEFTAVFSVLLVAFSGTREALEAAWKYIALMFMGAAIALLGFFLLFWAQAVAGGGHYSWEGLRAIAPRLPPPIMMAAFLLVLVGFGVKAGFVPLHTWLPDAHSQAPAPVCALLSAVKTTNSLYVILRLAALLPSGTAQVWMQAVGLVSVGSAAFLLLQVRDYKRLFAYSTVEHMGIIFTAAGMGGADGWYGAMLQMISHTVTKALCFLAAGAVLLLVGTRDIASVRGLIRSSPLVGGVLLGAALAIAGAPPFPVFLSEFYILRTGIAHGDYLVTALLATFITVAFFGILLHVNRMVFGASTERYPALPVACVAALATAAIPVLALGVFYPASLHALLASATTAVTTTVTTAVTGPVTTIVTGAVAP